MNTSSSPGADRSMRSDVPSVACLHRGVRALHDRCRSRAARNRTRRSDRRRASCAAARTACSGVRRGSPRFRRSCDSITSLAVPLREQLAVCDIGELVTALGFVHVMRADEHGYAAWRRAGAVLPRSRAAPSGSTPAVGSSSSSSCGSCSMQAASASRCFQPPDSEPVNWFARVCKAERFERAIHGFARDCASGRCARRSRDSRGWSGLPNTKSAASCSRRCA